MTVHAFDATQLRAAYGIQFASILLGEGAPFELARCLVAPGGTARLHRHHEHELLLIVRGRGVLSQGVLSQGERCREVSAGDVVQLEAFEPHRLANASVDEELHYLSVVWTEPSELATRRERGGKEGPGNVLVTATPPTPNGDLHVGHLSGPYLAADVFSRFCRMRGLRARLSSGVDDHQSYVVQKSRALGLTPSETADRLGDAMAGTLALADIQLDHWARPRQSRFHCEFVQRFFIRLYERGHIVKRAADTLYCRGCERFLFEAWVGGGCPHCGAPSDGNACEACARPNDCVDLREPRCKTCGEAPEVRRPERFFFPLMPWAAELRDYVDRVHMSAHMRAMCERMFADGLPEIAISQPADWGIRVPIDGHEQQAIYAWFEMAPGYLAATEELQLGSGEAADYRRVWASPDHEVMQFFGFDNGYFHALLFPALFLAFDPEIRLPSAFVVNEFYRYEGTKFSSSRNHAMWGRELLERVPADVARFYLAYDRPEFEQTNFRFVELERVVERELWGSFRQWLAEAAARMASECADRAPVPGAWTTEQRAFLEATTRWLEELTGSYGAPSFSLQRAARLLCELVRRGRDFGKSEDPWRGVPGRSEERRTGLALELLALRLLALGSGPLMPNFAERLWRSLGQEGALRDQAWPEAPAFIAGGSRISGLASVLEDTCRPSQFRSPHASEVL